MTRTTVVRGAAAAIVFLLCTGSEALAQQTKEQQACINNNNKAGANVAKQQGKENYACLRAAGKNDLVSMTAEECLTADVKGRLQKKRDKTAAVFTKYCNGAGVPDFGYTGFSNTNFSAETAELQLTADVFGSPLDAAVIDCDANSDACGCQQKVLKNVDKLAATKVGQFLKCKKEVLKAGAASDAALADCVEDPGTLNSIAADTKLKIAKAIANLNKAIIGCDEDAVTVGSFPGQCDGLNGAALRDCLDVLVECRVCQMINDIDGLWVNCDNFDNGLADSSCASGTGPAPTPTPPPAVFGSGDEIKGVLLRSNGDFHYGGNPGTAGADAVCNSNFAGTHACTYADLLEAETAGELAGAVDLNNNVVTSFWMIDAAEPDNAQCFEAGLDWNYATAHTGIGGRTVSLNNGTGDLAAPGPAGLICTQLHWVGCCP